MGNDNRYLKIRLPKQNINSRFLFWLGVALVVFYAVGPIFFPYAPIRQPELLPVYTLMMGIGQLMRKENNVKVSDDGNEDGQDS